MTDIPVEKLAKLSGLELSTEEREAIAQKLKETLAYVDNLKELNVEDTSPTSSPTGESNVYFTDGSPQKRHIPPGHYSVSRIL